MKTLDRYIVRNFLFAALLWFIIMMSLRIVTDLFVNADEFAKLEMSLGQLMGHIVGFYGYKSLAYFTELGGVIIVAAATFSLARMNHTNELTAILASGVSLHRVIWPVVLCSMLMGGFLILNQEVIMPPVADKLVLSHDDVPGKYKFQMCFPTDGTGAAWFAKQFHPTTQAMDGPIIVLRDKDYMPLGRISGKRAWPGKLKRRKGWFVSQGVLDPVSRGGNLWRGAPGWRRVYSNVGPVELLRASGQDEFPVGISNVKVADSQYGLTIEAERFVPDPPEPSKPRAGILEKPTFTFRTETGQILSIFSAETAAWTPPQPGGQGHWELVAGRLFYPSDLKVEEIVLRESSRWIQYMSIRQLGKLLKLNRIPDREGALLTKHIRVTDPINNLVMLLLGLPFILSRERNIKASATLCLLTVGGFYAFIHLCRNVGIPPIWSAWLPVLIFGPVAVVTLDSVKT